MAGVKEVADKFQKVFSEYEKFKADKEVFYDLNDHRFMRSVRITYNNPGRLGPLVITFENTTSDPGVCTMIRVHFKEPEPDLLKLYTRTRLFPVHISFSSYNFDDLKKEFDQLDRAFLRISRRFKSYFKIKEDQNMKVNVWTGTYSYPMSTPALVNVVVSGPATIAFFDDNSKVMVKRAKLEQDDPEKAIIMCLLKRMYGDDFHKEIKRLNKIMADATSSAVERDRIKHRRQIVKADKQTVARLKAEKIAQKQDELELFADDRRYPEIIDDDTIDSESIIPTDAVKNTTEKYEAPYNFGQKRPYTKEELDVVYDKSLTAREVAERLGRSVKAIDQYRTHHKIRTNRRGCHGKPFTEDEIILMEDPTIPSRDIAVTYGRNVNTINAWRKRHGIKTERRKNS